MPVDKFGRHVGRNGSSSQSFKNVVTKQYLRNEFVKLSKQLEKSILEQLEPLLSPLTSTQQSLLPMLNSYNEGRFVWHEDIENMVKELHDVIDRLMEQSENRVATSLTNKLDLYTNKIDNGIKLISAGLDELQPLLTSYQQGKLFLYEDVDLKLKEAQLACEQKLAENSKHIVDSANLEVKSKLNEIASAVTADAIRAVEAKIATVSVNLTRLWHALNARVEQLENKVKT